MVDFSKPQEHCMQHHVSQKKTRCSTKNIHLVQNTTRCIAKNSVYLKKSQACTTFWCAHFLSRSQALNRRSNRMYCLQKNHYIYRRSRPFLGLKFSDSMMIFFKCALWKTEATFHLSTAHLTHLGKKFFRSRHGELRPEGAPARSASPR